MNRAPNKLTPPAGTRSRRLAVAAALTFLLASSDRRCCRRCRFCRAFSPVPDALSSAPPSLSALLRGASSSTLSSRTVLAAVSKRQLAIFDGPELASIVSFLSDERGTPTPDLAARAIEKDRRVGGMSLVVGTVEDDEEEKGRRIVGVERPASSSDDDEDAEDIQKTYSGSDYEAVVSLGEGIYAYADSVATVPRSVSDEDAISTAAAALCGVHCGTPRAEGGTGKAVVVGGSDYARFAARGLEAVGADVSLVSIRPGVWLPSDSRVKVMEPTVGKLKLGFAPAIGKFDTLVDTLGDEAKLGEIRSFSDDYSEVDRNPLAGRWIVSELLKQHGCGRYVSTVTRSQKYVLDEGLLFARSPVLKYQDDVERHVPSSSIRRIRPPRNFGPLTLCPLMDQSVIYRADRNENGPNAEKDAFVRGCCFMDLTELKTWPRDSSGGTPIRFGFPVRGEVDLERAVKNARVDSVKLRDADAKKAKDKDAAAAERGRDEEVIEAKAPPAGAKGDETSPSSSSPVNGSGSGAAAKGRKKKVGSNPYVLDIHTVKDLNDLIVEPELDAVLFLSAAYCRTCKSLNPAYVRTARIHHQVEGDDVTYARADVGGPDGKLISRALQVDAVPSFVMFRKGERYGSPLGIKRLPSRVFDLAVEYLRLGKRWDPYVLLEDEDDDEEEENDEKGSRKVKVGNNKGLRRKEE